MATQLPVVTLMGPTASGKTALACELYDTGKFELISVDSALVYCDMDIGTAKPSKEEQQRYPHHLIDIIDPTEVYSVAEFVEDAENLIDAIHARGKIPLLVGGTMLYFKGLLEGLADNLPNSDADVRAKIQQKADEQGWQAVYDELVSVDVVAGQKFKVSDKQRIMRALEVYHLTGRPISELQAEQTCHKNTKYDFVNYALFPERSELHQCIEKRLEIMWEMGFLQEVISLIEKYNVSESTNSMRAVGYRQALDYLLNQEKNDKNHNDMKDKALYATRQLAKRQYTWLRSLSEKHQIEMICNRDEGIKVLHNRFR
ncbi:MULTISPECIES: tRNA (adenosine(37)-N6)-dimethylallyltransferase MiaA [unclassified Acinetobacter]|uniref:tRNA (adenosine(37)-N6)-dimethylallyltransferase MiaA n=1 Tax=unclassified Acinetobacter TaxID=196816 RepID=UPI0035BB9228